MSLIGWWKLDGNAYDSSPSANNGVVTGVTYDPSYGKIGQGALFVGGGNSYIDVTSYTLTTHHSLAFWMYGNTENSVDGSHVMGESGTVNNVIMAQDNIQFRVKENDGTNRIWDNTNDVDYYHRWRHVVVLFTPSGLYLYLDGVAQPDNPLSYSGVFVLDDFGTPTFTVGNQFTGNLNDIRVYDHILSVKEIKYLAEAKVLHWQFSQDRDSPGEIVSDGSGYGRDATLDINTPTWSSDTGVGVGCYDIPLGSAEYIEINSTDFPVEFGDAITIAFQVNYDGFNGWQTLAHGTTIGQKGVSYWLGTDGRQTDGFTDLMRWSINGDISNDFEHDMVAGEWYHIVATYDGSNCNVYINGVEKAGNFAQTGVINNQSGLKIGLLGGGGRHFGIEGTGYVLQPSSETNGILIQENYVTINGIEVFDPDQKVNRLIRIESTEVTVSNCILHGKYGNQPGLGMSVNGASIIAYVYNNIIYDLGENNAVYAGIRTNVTPTVYVYNNTFANISGQGVRQVTGTIIAKNNLALDCDFGCFVAVTPPFGVGSDYNASDDATDTGGDNDRINQTFTFVDPGELWHDPSFSRADFHLHEDDEGAMNYGVSLFHDTYISFFTDIDGEIRGEYEPSTGAWDIGADEYITPA